ncbi:FAD-dependent oxidoreductase [Seminibacterium arietis]|uniref:FAD-dependent oxidoreductase n=1 Tax=Seminibacterium arietis TaxID=1173502 RepID=A0ABW3I790_9PAST
MQQQKEIIIVGGGMVGAACAVELAKLGLQIHLIERSPLPHFCHDMPYDLRISAVSVASVDLLKQLGAWQHIEAMRVCPYQGLETWEIDGFSISFRSEQLNLSELGYMVENNVIQLGLWKTLTQFENVTTSVGFSVKQSEKCGENWQIRLENDEVYTAPLVIAADGANSQFRQLAGIGLTGWQYRQNCMLIVVNTELPQQDTTWQQFYPTGPRAFLPLCNHQACLVWYDSPQKIRQLSTLSAEKLAEQIHHYFPPRLGKVSVQCAGSFELIRRHAQHYFKQGVVLVGDSAHTINPLAGQGVNLGFKDVKTLLEVLESAVKNQQNFASDTVLKRYQRQRKADNLLMQSAMDLFYKSFKEDILPLKIARNVALLAINRAGFVKKQALKYALGLASLPF